MKTSTTILLLFLSLFLTAQVTVEENHNVAVGEVPVKDDVLLNVDHNIRIQNTNGGNPLDAGSLQFIESGSKIGTNAHGFQLRLNGVNSDNSLYLNGFNGYK